MANGFRRVVNENAGIQPALRELLATASTQYYDGDLIIMTEGKATRAGAQTDKPVGVLNAMSTPVSLVRPATRLLSTTLGEKIQYMPCDGNGEIFQTDLTGDDAPPINGTACNANTDATLVKVTAAGSTGDYDGGQIYCNGEQRTIVDDTVGGGVHTFTVVPAFTRAITTNDTAKVVPWSRGINVVKLSASSGQTARGISPAVADKTGGYARIEDVDLKNLTVNVSFPNKV